jgi:hypothetical protein
MVAEGVAAEVGLLIDVDVGCAFGSSGFEEGESVGVTVVYSVFVKIIMLGSVVGDEDWTLDGVMDDGRIFEGFAEMARVPVEIGWPSGNEMTELSVGPAMGVDWATEVEVAITEEGFPLDAPTIEPVASAVDVLGLRLDVVTFKVITL